MLGVSFTTWIVFLLGGLLGYLLGNKEGRIKFFRGLRGFLGSVSKSADRENRRQEKDLRKYHKGIYGEKRKRPKPQDDDDGY